MWRRRRPAKGTRARPSRAFVAELRERAEEATPDELELWIRDVRPVVRQVGRAELEHRGLRPTPDTMSV